MFLLRERLVLWLVNWGFLWVGSGPAVGRMESALEGGTYPAAVEEAPASAGSAKSGGPFG